MQSDLVDLEASTFSLSFSFFSYPLPVTPGVEVRSECEDFGGTGGV